VYFNYRHIGSKIESFGHRAEPYTGCGLFTLPSDPAIVEALQLSDLRSRAEMMLAFIDPSLCGCAMSYSVKIDYGRLARKLCDERLARVDFDVVSVRPSTWRVSPRPGRPIRRST
jgi:hypothetical protein